MPRVFRNVGEWLTECRGLIKQDLDNITLVTGVEGSGKSNLAYQLGKALDPTFGLPQVGFSIPQYIDIAKASAKGQAVQSDEFLANRRKAMRRETVDLLDFLQECRGLNLHHLICFPHVDLLDRAILDFRVRWHVHIPRRGLFHVKEKITYYAPGGTQQTAWRVVGSWNFGPNKGTEWEAYKAAKFAHMMRPKDGEETTQSEEWNLEELKSLPFKYDEARRNGRAVRGTL